MRNVVLPLFMLVAMAFTAFSLTAEALPDNLNIIMTIMLTTMAYKLYIGDQIPKVSYLTLLDKYITSCYFILFSMAMLTAGVYVLSRNEDGGPCSTIEAQPDLTMAMNVCWSGSLNKLEDRMALLAMLAWVLAHVWFTLKYLYNHLEMPTCLEAAAGTTFSWRDPDKNGSFHKVVADDKQQLSVATPGCGIDSPSDNTVLLRHSRQPACSVTLLKYKDVKLILIKNQISNIEDNGTHK